MLPPLLVRADRPGADPLDVVRGRDHDGSRWVLVGHGAEAEACLDAAERALSGREHVFGLAGLVLTGAAPSPAPDGLPVLLLVDDDPTGADALIGAWWAAYAGRGPRLPADLVALLASDRVSARTRAVHARRVLADDPGCAPLALAADALAVLRRVADLVVPQPGPPEEHLDLAARVDAQLADGGGDGWRPAGNPPDIEAYRYGLDRLGPDCTEATLRAAAESDDAVLASWFEDCRTDLVRQWLAHPASMARIGYDGFANGGDAPARHGFTDLTLGHRDDWEPAALAAGSLR